MTEYTSIRVTQEAKEAAQESKRDGETWNEYLQRCTDNPPEVREYVSAKEIAERSDFESSGQTIDYGNDLDEVKELMDKVKRLESMTREATNAAQSADRKLEDLGR